MESKDWEADAQDGQGRQTWSDGRVYEGRGGTVRGDGMSWVGQGRFLDFKAPRDEVLECCGHV